MRTRIVTLTAAMLLALVAAVGVSASNFTPDPLVQVSGLEPVRGCTADGVSGQSGTNYLHSEVEPWLDVNPSPGRDEDNVVGIWQQDRWSNGGARGSLPA